MQDRVPTPGQEGRVLITPESGSPFYATVEMADNPTQPGTPWNKASALQDDTAALYNENALSVPDDIFRALSTLVPNDKAAILLVVTDSSGNPAKAQVSVSPAVNGSTTLETNANGRLSVQVDPGTYNFTIPDTEFVTGSSAQVTVNLQDMVVLPLTLSIQEHGVKYVTTSTSISFPNAFPPVDIFAVSGGGSGAKCCNRGTDCASGGGGGRTKTLLAQNVAGKTIDITIGAGGIMSLSVNSDVPGVAGGSTIVSLGGSQIINLAGGQGGTVGANYYSYAIGGNGGSGGGGANSTQSSDNTVGNGGSDGSNGTGTRGGIGQGSTTRAFGESNGTLYCGGGGGASMRYVGTGGDGGGGSGIRLSGNSGGDATTYGGGGGAFFIDSTSINSRGGNGYQGLVILRW